MAHIQGKKKKESALLASVLGGTADAGVQTEGEGEESVNKTPRKLTEVDIVRRLNSKMVDEVSIIIFYFFKLKIVIKRNAGSVTCKMPNVNAKCECQMLMPYCECILWMDTHHILYIYDNVQIPGHIMYNIMGYTWQISKDADIAQINMEIERLQEKLRDVDDRIEDLEGKFV